MSGTMTIISLADSLRRFHRTTAERVRFGRSVALGRIQTCSSLLLVCALGLSVGAAAQTAIAPVGTSAKRPLNVLVLITDQHHADWLHCAGNSLLKTPNLDRLAQGGTRFTRAFVPAPFCSPTRAAIETGRYPSSLGIGRNINEKGDPTRMREPQQTYHHQLAALGYHCHQLGKWHLGDPAELKCFADAESDEKGFHQMLAEGMKKAGPAAYDEGPRAGETELVRDVYLREAIATAHRQWTKEKGTPQQDVGVIGRSRLKPEFRYESVLADYCIELLERHRDEPFAITYSVSPPHAPWVAPAPYYDQYDPQEFTLPVTWPTHPAAWETSAAARMARIYGEAGLREYLRCYAAQVTMMDWCMGRILDALEEFKLGDHTLVVFTSDHGNLLGQHGMMDKTVGTFYDDLTRVPLLMRLPGEIPAGRTTDALVATVDLAPTILDYAGAAPLASAHGHSLRGVIAGSDKGYEAVFSERGLPTKAGYSRMIRTRDWKLCVLPRGERELYDLKQDPDEVRNVVEVPANAQVLRELGQQLQRHMEAVGDPAARPVEAAASGRAMTSNPTKKGTP